MSRDRLPESIDPDRIFARRGSLEGEIPVSRFRRLKDYLSDTGGQARVQLDFGFDENGRRLVTGRLNARLALQCQRCLEDLRLEVDTPLRVLVLPSDEEVRALPGEEEAVVAGESLDLLALIEDELILSLPIVPYHGDEQCSEAFNRLQREQPAPGGGSDSPFAKLKELKAGLRRDKQQD